MWKADVVTSTTGPSPSSGYAASSSLPMRNEPEGTRTMPCRPCSCTRGGSTSNEGRFDLESRAVRRGGSGFWGEQQLVMACSQKASLGGHDAAGQPLLVHRALGLGVDAHRVHP